MRRDMHKVIVERPRWQAPWGGKGPRRPRDLEDYPLHEGMTRPHVLAGNPKSFGDHTRPLARYLRKQVGRPWNKVYSDICANLRAGAVLHDHVRNHVRDFVAFDVTMAEDGTPFTREARFRGERTVIWQPFFVHPRSGVLCLSSRGQRG